MAIHGRGFPIRPLLPRGIVSQGLGPGGGSVGPVVTVTTSVSSTMDIPMVQGRGYAICWAQTASDVASPSLNDPDTLGHTWVKSVETSIVFRAAIFTVIATATGTATVTCAAGTTTSWKWQYIEIRPSEAGRVIKVGNDTGINEDAGGTSHFCAASSGYDTLQQSTLIGCSAVTSTSGGFTASTGYTKHSGSDPLIYTCSGYFDAALTSERIPFTSGGSVNCKACTTFFYERLEDARVWVGSGGLRPATRIVDPPQRVIAY
jgi:hypothetical protein